MADSEKIQFLPFDKHADVDIRYRNLPHWFQPGAAIFVTFRTADSLPRDVVLRMTSQLEHWLASRSLPSALAKSALDVRLPQHQQILETLAPIDRQELTKQSNRLIHHALDECHGRCLLQRPELAKIVGEAILHGNDSKYDLDRFVIMPNHVHAIVQFRTGSSLSVVGQSWMRYSARQINRITGDRGAFWQAEPFDHIVRSANQFVYLQAYIEQNPAKACLGPDRYFYWNRSESPG